MKNTIDIDKLTHKEKLQLLDELWDNIRNSEGFEAPNWHLNVLKEREERYEAGEEKLIDWDSFKKSID